LSGGSFSSEKISGSLNPKTKKDFPDGRGTQGTSNFLFIAIGTPSPRGTPVGCRGQTNLAGIGKIKNNYS